ncbi:hypothetical protein KKD52_15195 [Myxococcota bacterium]|nr:hypothetical protein [Myxococcota bacterium]
MLAFVGLLIIIPVSISLSGREVRPEKQNTAKMADPLKEPAAGPTALEELWIKHKIKDPIDQLKKPLERRTLLTDPVTLDQKKPLWSTDTLTLDLAVIEKAHAMGNRDTHAILLKIRNVSTGALAFRVDTAEGRLFVECGTMKPLAAHQFILPAGGSVERLEGCTGAPDLVELVVRRVQVMPLPGAAVVTLMRVLQPLGLSYKMRSQHKTPELNPLPACIVPDAEVLQNRIAGNPEAWFEIMDFLARHDCATESVK